MATPTQCRAGPAGPRRGASDCAPGPGGRGGPWPPSSASSERRAAAPISPTLAPPLPIRMPFWDSVSAQTSAPTMIRPSSRASTSLTADLDRVGDLLAGTVQHLLADQLGQKDLARLVAVILGPGTVGTLGNSSPSRSIRTARPSPLRALIGKTSSTPSSSAAAASTGTSSLGPSPICLVHRADHRQPGSGSEQRPDDEAIAGANPLLAVDHDQSQIGVGQLTLDPPLHALGQDIARPLHARQVDQDQLAAQRRRSVGTPRIARRVVCGRTETIATREPTIALTSVDLPTLGRPASPTKPARVTPSRARTSACSSSISPPSVSWSMSAEVQDAVDGGLGRGRCRARGRSPRRRAHAARRWRQRRQAERRGRRWRYRCRGVRGLAGASAQRRSARPRGDHRLAPAAASAALTAARRSPGTSLRSRLTGCRAVSRSACSP